VKKGKKKKQRKKRKEKKRKRKLNKEFESVEVLRWKMEEISKRKKKRLKKPNYKGSNLIRVMGYRWVTGQN
jgi:hypothetical protein